MRPSVRSKVRGGPTGSWRSSGEAGSGMPGRILRHGLAREGMPMETRGGGYDPTAAIGETGRECAQWGSGVGVGMIWIRDQAYHVCISLT